MYQGLTGKEISAIRLSHIDLDEGTLQVQKTAATNARTLYLKPDQFRLFYDYISQLRSSARFSADESDDKIRFLNSLRAKADMTELIARMLRKYRFLCPGKTLTPENIRKSLIYNLLNVDKYPVDEVQYFSGHKWPGTTAGYQNKIDLNDHAYINSIHPMEKFRL